MWPASTRSTDAPQVARAAYPLSSVQVRPARYTSTGTLPVDAFAGKNKLKFASRPPRAADYLTDAGCHERGAMRMMGKANLKLVLCELAAVDFAGGELLKRHGTGGGWGSRWVCCIRNPSAAVARTWEASKGRVAHTSYRYRPMMSRVLPTGLSDAPSTRLAELPSSSTRLRAALFVRPNRNGT